MKLLNVNRSIAFLVVIAVTSLGANGILTWRWLSDKNQLQRVVSVQQGELQLASTANEKLAAQNTTYAQNLTEKDQQLAAKLAELEVKQNELTTLTKQLDDRKKELDAKAKELTDAQKRISDQKSQLDANSAELSKLRDRPPLFSFQVKSSGISDIDAKKAAVQQVVSDAFDTIQDVYGKPYLLHSVTITFVDHFENDSASGEILISNSSSGLSIDIHIKDFDKNSFTDVNTIIHEVVHAFHGLAVIEPTAFEEGITVAATDAVMAKMIAAGKLPHFSPLYIRLSDADYQKKLSTSTVFRDADAFYGSSDVADDYQLVGKAWYELYESDKDFFKKFNEKIYTQKRAGQEVTEKMVLDTIKEVQPNVSLTGAAWVLR